MHAYLLIGRGEGLDAEAKKLCKRIGASLMELPLAKIEDVRTLSRFSRFAISSGQAIYIKGIESATHEAQNAFLKSLEEPQDNLYYILTASGVGKVLPTIVSRCQVITVKSQQLTVNTQAEEFDNRDLVEKLVFVENIKKREEAINFLEALISLWHQKLIKADENYSDIAQNLKKAINSLNALQANGNVLLQLTNFVIWIG